jgi:ABC-type sugar transport system ATPase subunit
MAPPAPDFASIVRLERVQNYNASVIVLDEPMAALGVAEVRKVIDFAGGNQYDSERPCSR